MHKPKAHTDASFWNKTFSRKYYGEALTEYKNYDNRSNLLLACTQLNVTTKEQNRILKEWITQIPQLPITHLMISSHVPQKLIDAIALNKKLKCVYIKWTKAKSIKPIATLPNLEHLYLGSGSSITDLAELAKLTNLTVLKLENTKKTTDYSFLAAMKKLKILELSGSMYSTLQIDSLDTFISELTKLKSFVTANVKVENPKLENILPLKELICLHLPNDYTQEDFKLIKKSLPSLIYEQDYFNELMRTNLLKINNSM